MSYGIALTVQSPPLDPQALRAFISQLPGFVERADGALVSGASVLVRIEPPVVLIAFRWQDNRCGHGALVGGWVLDRHRCTGQDIDHGTALADSNACRVHLARTSRVTPTTPERVTAAVGALLIGADIGRIEITRAELRAIFVRDEQPVGVLVLEPMSAALTPAPEAAPLSSDEAALLVLAELLEIGGPLEAVQAGWAAPLTLTFAAEVLTISAAGDAVAGSMLWSIEDGEGRGVAQAHVGDGPVVL